MSADLGDALFGLRLVSGLGLRGKGEDSCPLPFTEPRQQHDFAIGELERVSQIFTLDRTCIARLASRRLP